MKCNSKRFTERVRCYSFTKLSAGSIIHAGLALLIIPATFSTTGCRDQTLNLPPVVTFQEPYEDQPFEIGDTVAVSALIRDETEIEKITLQLVKSDFTPCAQAYEIPVQQREYTLNRAYVIPDGIGYSAYYYILIRAYDNKDFKNKYRRIQISPKPAQYRGLIVLTQSAPLLKALYLLDSNQNINKLADIQGDSGSSSIWPGSNLLSSAGSIYGNLITIRLKDSSQTIFQTCIPDPPHPYFHEIEEYDNRLFVCREEGFVTAYTSSGSISIQTPSSISHYPSQICFDTEHFIVFWKDRNNSGGYIARHYLSSGHQRDVVACPYTILDMFCDEDGIVSLFYQDGATCKAKQLISNALQNWISPPAGTFRDVIYLGAGTFALSMTTGTYLLDYSGSSTNLLTAANSGLLAYDKNRQQIYSAIGNSVIIKNLQSGNQQSFAFPNPVSAVFPWYER